MNDSHEKGAQSVGISEPCAISRIVRGAYMPTYVRAYRLHALGRRHRRRRRSWARAAVFPRASRTREECLSDLRRLHSRATIATLHARERERKRERIRDVVFIVLLVSSSGETHARYPRRPRDITRELSEIDLNPRLRAAFCESVEKLRSWNKMQSAKGGVNIKHACNLS